MTKHRRRKPHRFVRRDLPRPKPQRYTWEEAQATIKQEKLHVQEVVRAGGGLRINVVETDKRAKARTLYVKPEPQEAAA
jgi:hypothetical protein